jgi:hypothetical protein
MLARLAFGCSPIWSLNALDGELLSFLVLESQIGYLGVDALVTAAVKVVQTTGLLVPRDTMVRRPLMGVADVDRFIICNPRAGSRRDRLRASEYG